MAQFGDHRSVGEVDLDALAARVGRIRLADPLVPIALVPGIRIVPVGFLASALPTQPAHGFFELLLVLLPFCDALPSHVGSYGPGDWFAPVPLLLSCCGLHLLESPPAEEPKTSTARMCVPGPKVPLA
jgi:hypothetical protein